MRLGEGATHDAVNTVLLSPKFPGERDILVLAGETLLASRDGGINWSEWKARRDLRGITCIAAPEGLEAGACLLAGLAEGGVLRI